MGASGSSYGLSLTRVEARTDAVLNATHVTTNEDVT